MRAQAPSNSSSSSNPFDRAGVERRVDPAVAPAAERFDPPLKEMDVLPGSNPMRDIDDSSFVREDAEPVVESDPDVMVDSLEVPVVPERGAGVIARRESSVSAVGRRGRVCGVGPSGS